MARSSWRGKALGASALLALLAAWAAGDGFQFLGPLSRIVTPDATNGANAAAVFCFSNPSDSGVSGEIYTLLGRHVASLPAPIPTPGTSRCSGAGTLFSQYTTWDGRSHGNVVRGGVYVYEFRVEGHAFTGTLVVIR